MEANKTDPPLAHVAHQLPGRARLSVPARRGDPAFLGALAARLGAAPRVAAAVANARTGSILLTHEGPLEPILAQVAGVVRLAAPPAPVRFRPRQPKGSDRVGPPVLPLTAAAAGFVALAALQLARGRISGSATEHFWGAYNALRTLRRPGIAAALAGVGAVQLARGQVLSPAISLLFYAAHARAQTRRQRWS